MNAPNLIAAARALAADANAQTCSFDGIDGANIVALCEAVKALPNEVDHGPLVLVPAKWVEDAARALDFLTKEAKRGDLWAAEARSLHDKARVGNPPHNDKVTMEASINRLAKTLRYDTDHLAAQLRSCLGTDQKAGEG
jgi:hypothetical protein